MSNATGTLHDVQKNSYENTGTPGETKQRVQVANDVSSPVPITGDVGFSPSGLNNAGLISLVTLNSSTWVALPATALTDRNALGIQNLSSIPIKINYSSGVVGYVGWEVGAGAEFFVDIKDTIVIYAKASSGTPTVTVMELS